MSVKSYKMNTKIIKYILIKESGDDDTMLYILQKKEKKSRPVNIYCRCIHFLLELFHFIKYYILITV